jgi:hypothetical protein
MLLWLLQASCNKQVHQHVQQSTDSCHACCTGATLLPNTLQRSSTTASAIVCTAGRAAASTAVLTNEDGVQAQGVWHARLQDLLTAAVKCSKRHSTQQQVQDCWQDVVLCIACSTTVAKGNRGQHKNSMQLEDLLLSHDIEVAAHLRRRKHLHLVNIRTRYMHLQLLSPQV